ncbi:MAG TPA: hypothetical protein VFE47_19845 [Tepidisphaeraceae bacterium]|jgi:hypothetical protein|nr:hypothetical protein [Tepidisphaeraceae bacterium]
MAKMGENDYRIGAKERMEEAYILLRQSRFGGAIYITGRATEGILRAVIWKSDPEYRTGRKSLETGHDLRRLLDVVGRLGIMAPNRLKDQIAGDVQHVARLWFNDMRFLPESRIRREWLALREISGKRPLKLATGEYYDACSAILKKCEVLWPG